MKRNVTNSNIKEGRKVNCLRMRRDKGKGGREGKGGEDTSCNAPQDSLSLSQGSVGYEEE